MAGAGKKRDTGCPIAFALDTFGDRWSLLIIRDLMLKTGHETYGDFLGAGEAIATNILADRLKELEAAGIILKSPDPDNRRRNIYRLTEKGRDLAPIMAELICWGAKYDANTGVQETFVEKIKSDRAGFIAGILRRPA